MDRCKKDRYGEHTRGIIRCTKRRNEGDRIMNGGKKVMYGRKIEMKGAKKQDGCTEKTKI